MPKRIGQSELEQLPGVGPGIAAKLNSLGIGRRSDLLFHLPLRFEDRTRITPIQRLQPGLDTQVEGRVIDQQIRPGRRRSLQVLITDDTAHLMLRFFNFYPNQLRLFTVGHQLRCFGEVRFGPAGYEMAHPQCQLIPPGQDLPLPEHLTPIYPTTAGLGVQRLSTLIEFAVNQLAQDQWPLPDPLGDIGVPGQLKHALLSIHRPGTLARLDSLLDGSDPNVQRLALEELSAHHLALARLNQAREQQLADALRDKQMLAAKLVQQLPFELTQAQTRVIDEIRQDIASPRPMRRLLQGDVGSGKTVVAAAAAAQAIGAGAQVAIIAPTEILAEQHLNAFSDWFTPLGIEPVWLAGKVKGKARGLALDAIAGGAPLVIGTHALFQRGVEFKCLRLAIVDEQHRFGVHQRLSLAEKGSNQDRNRVPHQLVMTATPIPRTLAMTAYAGLEISVIDELPPGRKPVTTALIPQERRTELVERIRLALAEGRQAYWVCPLIEESDVLEAEAAETTATELTQALPECQVGLIHGRMKPAEKQSIMAAFKAGQIQLLVATTVIEVGVDVPNASLMMIENAERLGLSQLHQLRGRVGRGSSQSACVLMFKSPLGELARARL
ncbi:MAG: ATP-dependent DNA helicase RecG, partial [Pseudomonadota bacterium]